jgi:hypothetical protein
MGFPEKIEQYMNIVRDLEEQQRRRKNQYVAPTTIPGTKASVFTPSDDTRHVAILSSPVSFQFWLDFFRF